MLFISREIFLALLFRNNQKKGGGFSINQSKGHKEIPLIERLDYPLDYSLDYSLDYGVLEMTVYRAEFNLKVIEKSTKGHKKIHEGT